MYSKLVFVFSCFHNNTHTQNNAICISFDYFFRTYKGQKEAK
jgi:hypothetical protein